MCVQAGVCFSVLFGEKLPAGFKGGGVWPQACTQAASRVSLIERALKGSGWGRGQLTRHDDM